MGDKGRGKAHGVSDRAYGMRMGESAMDLCRLWEISSHGGKGHDLEETSQKSKNLSECPSTDKRPVLCVSRLF